MSIFTRICLLMGPILVTKKLTHLYDKRKLSLLNVLHHFSNCELVNAKLITSSVCQHKYIEMLSQDRIYAYILSICIKFSPGTIPNPYQLKKSHKNKHFFRTKITCIHLLGVWLNTFICPDVFIIACNDN